MSPSECNLLTCCGVCSTNENRIPIFRILGAKIGRVNKRYTNHPAELIKDMQGTPLESTVERFQRINSEFLEEVRVHDPNFERLYLHGNERSIDFQTSFSFARVIEGGSDFSTNLLRKKLEPLLPEDQDKVEKALKCTENKVISCLAGAEVDTKSLRTLANGELLNDKIINFCMELHNEKDKFLFNWTRSSRSYFFHSYFLGALTDTCGNFSYEKVKGWTTNVNVLLADKLFFPVFGDSHWMLVVVFVHEKRIKFYNSMKTITFSSMGEQSMAMILKWLSHESQRMRMDCRNFHAEKGKCDEICCEVFCEDDWKMEMPETPQQTNGYDCGVFVLLLVDLISDDYNEKYAQGDKMYLYREKIASSILFGMLPVYELQFKRLI